MIWPIIKPCQCILQGVRFLLANHTLLFGTSETFSYQDTKHPMISTTTFDPKTPGEHKRINHFFVQFTIYDHWSLTKSLSQVSKPQISFYPSPQTCWDTRGFQKLTAWNYLKCFRVKKWTETWCALRAWRLLRRWQYQSLWCPRCPCRWFPCPSRCPCRWYRAPRRSSL